jgi:hypothetical protein
MANTILTPDEITKDAVAVLHEELQLVNKVDRQYDSSFAKANAKIGDTLRVRKPAQFTVADGKTLSTQDFKEEQTTLTVATQKHIATEFSTDELTLELDEFSSRVSAPAMSRLAAEIETVTAENLYSQIGNYVFNNGGLVWKNAVQAGAIMTQNLAPTDMRSMMVDPLTQVEILDNTKGLFQSAEQIKKQYEKGILGRTGGFDFYETTYNPSYVIGADVAGTVNDTYSAGETTITLAGFGNGQVIAKGTVITIAGVFMIQPETKKVYGSLKGIPVLADATADGSGNVVVTIPALYGSASGAIQNVSALPANGAVASIVGSADTTLRSSMAFHKNFACFVGADIWVPNGVNFASKSTYEGVTLRMVSQYDINSDKAPVRFDVIFGSQVIRPELACKLLEPNV